MIGKIIKNDDVEIIKLFVDYGMTLNTDDNMEIIKFCIDYGMSLDEIDEIECYVLIEEMLVDALLANSICVAEYLVQQGAKPDYLYGCMFCKYDVLGKCCWNGYYEACEFILENVSYTQELIDDDLFSGKNLYVEVGFMSPENLKHLDVLNLMLILNA